MVSRAFMTHRVTGRSIVARASAVKVRDDGRILLAPSGVAA